MSKTYDERQKHLTRYFQNLDSSISDDWQVRVIEVMPIDEPTHIQVTGSDTKVALRGKNKGNRVWIKPFQNAKQFLISKGDWRDLMMA